MHIDAHSHSALQIVAAEAAGQVVNDQVAQEAYVLNFQSLFHARRDFAFPCDARGCVDLDAMSEKTRNNYLYARAMIGREVAWPRVRRMAEAGIPRGSHAGAVH